MRESVCDKLPPGAAAALSWTPCNIKRPLPSKKNLLNNFLSVDIFAFISLKKP
jgi:hypothetical protein